MKSKRSHQCDVHHQCGSSGLPAAIPGYRRLIPIRAREIKGSGITEGWCAAVLLMCATHFYFITPRWPKTFGLLLLASCSPCLLPIELLFFRIPLFLTLVSKISAKIHLRLAGNAHVTEML